MTKTPPVKMPSKTPPQDAASANSVRALRERIENAFSRRASLSEQTRDRDCKHALARFLKLTGWPHGRRRIFEAMPHIDPLDSLQSFRIVLFRLGFMTTVEDYAADRLRQEYLPCFLRTEDGRILLIEQVSNDHEVEVFDASTGRTTTRRKTEMEGELVFPEQHAAAGDAEAKPADRWSIEILRAFKPVIGKIFLISFIANIFALMPPLFVMAVYDKAIGAESLSILVGLAVGVTAIVAADFALRFIRGRLQAYLGARLDNQLSEQTFQQLLYMPLAFTEAAPIGAQLTRLKQMSAIRDAFTGALATALFDLPFLVLFIATIALIGGPLVAVPIALIAGYAALAAWAIPATKYYVKIAGNKKAQLHNLVVEAASLQSAIFDLNAEDVWRDKHRRLTAESVEAARRSKQLNNLLQTISQSFVSVAGVLTLAIGVSMVINGALSAGALIAVMALSWRVLSPMRAIFLSTLTLGQTLQSIDQVDRLLKMPVERAPNATPSIARTFGGRIMFDRVSFRYPQQQEPALRGVSFEAKPGEMVCICGQSGSGKTTLLRLLLGLYQQQAGSIFIDGLDLRQLDLGEWRQSISVCPEASDFIFGTVAQNIRLSHPSATNEEVEEIARRFRLDQYYGTTLDKSLDSKITASALTRWPDALKKRLSLCRTFIRQAPIYLLDTPADNLDAEGERALLEILAERRGASTILMSTHRPSHMRLADHLLWLDRGAVRKLGAPDEIITELLAA